MYHNVLFWQVGQILQVLTVSSSDDVDQKSKDLYSKFPKVKFAIKISFKNTLKRATQIFTLEDFQSTKTTSDAHGYLDIRIYPNYLLSVDIRISHYLFNG